MNLRRVWLKHDNWLEKSLLGEAISELLLIQLPSLNWIIAKYMGPWKSCYSCYSCYPQYVEDIFILIISGIGRFFYGWYFWRAANSATKSKSNYCQVYRTWKSCYSCYSCYPHYVKDKFVLRIFKQLMHFIGLKIWVAVFINVWYFCYCYSSHIDCR